MDSATDENEEIGDFLRQHAPACRRPEQHEGEFAALREEQDEKRPLGERNAGAPCERPQHQSLHRIERDDQPHDEQRLFAQHREIGAQADRHEEEPQQQPFERLNRGLDLVAVLGLGKQHPGEEGAERHGKPDGLEAERDPKHQEQRERGEDLAQARAGDVAKDRPREVVAEDQRGSDHGRRVEEVAPAVAEARVLGDRGSGNDREHRDHGEILEQQDRETRLAALRGKRPAVHQGLQARARWTKSTAPCRQGRRSAGRRRAPSRAPRRPPWCRAPARAPSQGGRRACSTGAWARAPGR